MRLMACVLVAAVVVGAVRPAAAQPGPLAPLAPTGGPPVPTTTTLFDPDSLGTPPPEPALRSTPIDRSPNDRPPNVLGAPVMGSPVRPSDRDPVPAPERRPAPTPSRITPAVATDATDATPVKRAVALGAPESAGRPVSARMIETAGGKSSAPEAGDAVGDLLTKRSKKSERTPDRDSPDERASEKFGEKIGDALGDIFGKRCDPLFKSDHIFDGFISPVTNPFLFEDPRSVTEVRPIFIYQNIPSRNPDFKGGNIYFFGTQARVAVTDRLSFVFNKIGGISIHPGSGSTYPSDTGFAELWLGPKYTFLRGEATGSLLAGGLQFQIPIGSQNVFQNTGSLSVVPWLTYAQNFARDFRYGSFNGMLGTGYSFSTGNERSDYYYLSAHLDMDVLNNHKFYPLVEMNWFLYTTNGKTLPVGVEGRDLFNLGGMAKGNGLVTGALGARYKISEAAQIGAAFEIPLAGPKDLFRYRFTLDFILRY